MVFRLPLLSSLWIPLTVILISTSLDIIGRSNGVDGEWVDPYAVIAPKRNLTGIPQIDYLTDPNLPRELNGYNLSSYPFFNKVPTNISFNCQGLKDGFYASIEHKCQLYHHCLFGTRYDFLCANYTAFDQRTFICQFVSEVDCPNSNLFFHRNDALYIATTTSTVAPVLDYGLYQGRRRSKFASPGQNKQAVDTGAPRQDAQLRETASAADLPPPGQRGKEVIEDEPDDDYVRPYRRQRPRQPKYRQRWRQRQRPVYDDYYDDDYYDEPAPARRRPLPRRALARYEDDYYDTDSEEEIPRRKMKRKNRRKNQDPDSDYQSAADDASSKLTKTTAAPIDDTKAVNTSTTTTTTTTTTTPEPPPLEMTKTRDEIFLQSRPPPKIRSPAPRSERNKFSRAPPPEQVPSPSVSSSLSSSATQPNENVAGKKKSVSNNNSAKPLPTEAPDQYDQFYYEEDYEQAPAPAKKSNKYLPLPTTPTTTTSTTTTTTTTTPTPRTTTTTRSTPAPLQQVYEYEYEYEDDQPVQINIPTTTTTTTTTQRPSSSGGNRKFRNGRKRQQEDLGPIITSSSIQSETSPSAQDVTSENTNKYSIQQSSSSPADTNEAVDNTRSRAPSIRQPYTSRPRHSLFNKHINNIPSTTTPVSTTTTIKTSVTTSERTVETIVPSRKSQGGRFQIQNESPTTTPSAVDTASSQRSRNSRFWQRQPVPAVPVAKADVVPITTTTTTTPAPDVADYAYYDESPPLTRYGQRSASTYQQFPSTLTGPGSDYIADAPQPTSVAVPQSPSISPPSTRDNSDYQVVNEPQKIYRSNSVTNVDTRYEQNSIPRAAEQSNYVTPFGTPPSLPQTTATAYMQFHQPRQHQPAQSSQQLQQEHLRNQHHPEFISLLAEDEEESYYPSSGSVETGARAGSSHLMSMIPSQEPTSRIDPQQTQALQIPQQQPASQQIPQQNRFRNQLTRMFTSPQELFPVYTTPPQYIKAIRPRHVYPTMFLPYATY